MIVSFSGGKDSTAMILHLLESGEDITEILYVDTGWEFQEITEHIAAFEKRIGMQITRLESEQSFNYLLTDVPVKRKESGEVVNGIGWPWLKTRWCTSQKIILQDRYTKEKYGNPVRCIGYAADEYKRARKMILSNKGRLNFRFPLIEAGITEAMALKMCYAAGFDFGGMYEVFPRVSCWCCPLQRESELFRLFEGWPELWEELQRMDKAQEHTGRTFRPDGVTVASLTKRFQRISEQRKRRLKER